RDRLHAPMWMGETGENTDEWIARMRGLLEKNNVGWCFWPYKKMDAPTSPVTFDRPDGWDQIIQFAKLNRNIGTVKQRLPQRPSQAVIDHAIANLLENIRFDRERRNEGYIHALLPDTK
ncbi:MAG TPA: glycoside hydrolase family 5 protein, partial [Terriglobus sp.]